MSIDLEALLAEVEGRPQSRRPSLQSMRSPTGWPALLSTYFVQADADVAPLRELGPALANRNIGIATNIDSLAGTPWSAPRPALERLVHAWLAAGQPVYLDSGVYPRFAAGGRPPPDFDAVLRRYDQFVARASHPSLLSLTAPDAISASR